MKYGHFLTTVLLLALFSSCSYKSRDILFKTARNVPQDSISPVYVMNNRPTEKDPNTISVDDILSITNLQNPELISGTSGTAASGGQSQAQGYKVQADGTVAVPVLGRVNLLGLTELQAEDKLTQMYQKEFLKAPIIRVMITNMSVTIFGEVSKPGNVVLSKDRNNLVEVLGLAGGLTQRSNKAGIRIIRGDKANPEIIYVDLRDIRALGSEELYLRNNDIIYVETNGATRTVDKISRVSSVAQIGLLFVNAALIIYTLTK